MATLEINNNNETGQKQIVIDSDELQQPKNDLSNMSKMNGECQTVEIKSSHSVNTKSNENEPNIKCFECNETNEQFESLRLKQERFKKLLKGISLAILSALFFSITTLVVKYVHDLNAGTIAAFRYIGIIILAFPLTLESSQPVFGPSGSHIWIVLRGLAGGTSVFFRYSALHYISMADSTVIILSMPIFVFVFARIFLKEPFGRFHVFALILSMVGIVFASKIDIFSFFKKSTSNEMFSTTTAFSTLIYENETISTTTEIPIVLTSVPSVLSSNRLMSDQSIGTLYSLGSTLIGCSVYIIIRKLKSVNKYVILFNFSIVCLLEMLIINFLFFDFNLPKNGWAPYLMVLVGILSFYAQILLTRAIQIEEAGVVSVVRTSSEAFFSFLLEIICFGQMPDLFSIIGALLVLSAVLLLSFQKFVAGLSENDPMKKRFKFFT